MPFWPYDAHVGVLVDAVVASDVHLVDLTQGEVATHVGQGTQDASVASSHAAAQRTRNKEIAHENGDMVVPHIVNGGHTAALTCLVDDIVVDERGIVQHLDGCSALQGLVVNTTKEAGTQQRDDGPDHLTLGLEVVGHNAIGQLAVARQRGHDDVVELVQFGPQLLLDMFKRNCH